MWPLLEWNCFSIIAQTNKHSIFFLTWTILLSDILIFMSQLLCVCVCVCVYIIRGDHKKIK